MDGLRLLTAVTVVGVYETDCERAAGTAAAITGADEVVVATEPCLIGAEAAFLTGLLLLLLVLSALIKESRKRLKLPWILSLSIWLS